MAKNVIKGKNSRILNTNNICVELEKLREFYFMQNHWISLYQEGLNLAVFFNDKNIRTVAIYGYKELGRLLHDELREHILVKYIIDRDKKELFADIPIYLPDDDLPVVDAIVVCATYYYEDIKKVLEKKTKSQILSLKDVIYGI